MWLKHETGFSAAHFLHANPDSICYRLHGHNYRVQFRLKANQKLPMKNGMVVDYHRLNNLVGELDHKLLLPAGPEPKEGFQYVKDHMEQRGRVAWGDFVIVLPFAAIYQLPYAHSTVENLVHHLSILARSLFMTPAGEVTVWETENSSASVSWGNP